MKTKEIDISIEYNQALVDYLRIINAHSRSGNSMNYYENDYPLIDDRFIDPIRKQIKDLVKK